MVGVSDSGAVGIMDLIDIRTELNTRNVIRWAQETRYAVNCVRVNHNERVVLLTLNGKIIAEKLFVGMERLPEIKEVFRLRKLFNCERE